MPVSPVPGEPAPDGLDLVIDFVNTLDLDEGLDALASTNGLDGWLAERALLRANGPRASERDRRQAVELREALRALMLHDNSDAAGPYDARIGRYDLFADYIAVTLNRDCAITVRINQLQLSRVSRAYTGFNPLCVST